MSVDICLYGELPPLQPKKKTKKKSKKSAVPVARGANAALDAEERKAEEERKKEFAREKEDIKVR